MSGSIEGGNRVSSPQSFPSQGFLHRAAGPATIEFADMKPRPLPALCAITALLLAGCATFNQREMAVIRQSGAPRVVVSKIERGDPITPSEIITLSRRVPDSFLIRYLEDDGVDYIVNRADVLRMRAAGVRARVIDTVILEGDRFARDHAPSYDSAYGVSWGGSGMYGADPYYSGW